MKILVIASYPNSILNFRGHLLQRLMMLGHEVTVAAPGLTGAWADGLEKLGIHTVDYRLDRASVNLFSDWATLRSLYQIVRRLKPDIVLGYTVKPVIYGTFAARLAGVKKCYSLITGLGYAFSGSGVKRRIIRTLLMLLYKVALRLNRRVIFQNKDDQALFHQLKLVSAKKTSVVNGSGVDLTHYEKIPLPALPMRFLLVARLLKEKGIFEYLEAAKQLKKSHPEAVCQLLGPVDPNPGGIGLEQVQSWHEQGWLEYLGETTDVRPFIQQCHVFVLPSYREGTPRTVLEAMSIGRPIITTDVPGCRETINANNGILIPAQDSHALYAAMLKIMADEVGMNAQANASRLFVEEKFDVHHINVLMTEVILEEKMEQCV
ncbi:MAG: glycosyltransferase family 4 protein [Methylococcales bacterium]|jgi:glycosyltransferase involved in cell wall biosynthesis|nr:glycosyltransferase family 4 protein [Methylococcales bacterium]MBT7443134.1 glycosyltransferase family 4 protein [Methylococcales bacterium]